MSTWTRGPSDLTLPVSAAATTTPLPAPLSLPRYFVQPPEPSEVNSSIGGTTSRCAYGTSVFSTASSGLSRQRDRIELFFTARDRNQAGGCMKQ